MTRLFLPMLFCLCASAAAWKDRAEYAMALDVRAAASPVQRIALLDQWKAKYPASEFQQERRELYLAAYQSLGDSQHMLGIAAEMLAAQPGQPVGAYWFATLLPEAGQASAEQLTMGEKAAQQLLAAQTKKAGVEWLAHRVLGWIHWQRNEYGPAQEEFRKCLELEPGNVMISAWLGTVLAAGQEPDQRVPALWQLARAVSNQGPGALPDESRRQLTPVFERLYSSFHGETEGIDRLRTAAAASVFPPAGFDIESAATIAIRKQDELLSRTNPQLAEWLRVRYKLEAPTGEQYFSDTLHGNALPKLKGTLIQATPPDQPAELTIGIVDVNTAEITLKLSAAFPNAAPPGTVLEFEGTADSFVRSPFGLVVLSAPEKISGWPPPPPPPPPPSKKR